MKKVLEKKRVKLYRDGGSQKIIVSKAWLRRVGMEDAEEGELLLMEDAITLQAVDAEESASIEDDPEFQVFLTFLAKQALSHPETLVDASPFYDRDADLVVRDE
jgi:hypothetical protein